MDLTTSHYVQLIVALLGGITLFGAAYTMPQRWVVWALVLLVPFQLIESRFGSINMVLTYMVFVALFARGYIKRFPFLPIVTVILFVYGMSLSQSIRATFFPNVLHVITVVSNFLLFYIVYNHIRQAKDITDTWRMLTVLNLLVIAYCLLEMIAGAVGIRIFGVEELEVRSQRAEDGFLTGPFRAISMTAEYLALQSLMSMYALMHSVENRKRLFWIAMTLINLGLLIATSSRGGVISLAVALVVFAFMFKRQIGTRRLVTWFGLGSILFMGSAFVIINFTSYNVLFDRLEGTEIEGGIPDTRQGWVELWPRVIEKPVLGHGPRMKFDNEHLIRHPEFTPMPYPHSAYLFIIYTIGFTGLFVYLWFFAGIARQYLILGNNQHSDAFSRGIPYLGFVLLLLTAVSEIRMEMFRYILHAYQQYFFTLTASFLAMTHVIARSGRSEPEKVDVVEQDNSPKRILRYKGGAV